MHEEVLVDWGYIILEQCMWTLLFHMKSRVDDMAFLLHDFLLKLQNYDKSCTKLKTHSEVTYVKISFENILICAKDQSSITYRNQTTSVV